MAIGGFQFRVEPLTAQRADYFIAHFSAALAIKAAAFDLSLFFSRLKHLPRLEHQVMKPICV